MMFIDQYLFSMSIRSLGIYRCPLVLPSFVRHSALFLLSLQPWSKLGTRVGFENQWFNQEALFWSKEVILFCLCDRFCHPNLKINFDEKLARITLIYWGKNTDFCFETTLWNSKAVCFVFAIRCQIRRLISWNFCKNSTV